MKQKRTFSFVVILVLCYCLFMIKDTGIEFFTDKVTIQFLLVLSTILLIVLILLFITKIHTTTFKCKPKLKFEIKIDKKSSNDEIIKLIEDYSKNKGEENDNK